MSEIEQIIEGTGGYDYLIRSISIVTLLYERGILKELLEEGRLSEEDIDLRASLLRQRYPEVVQSAPEPEEEPEELEEFE
ncbi:MAG: hypothetical protein WCX65_00270 [bacterium]